MAIDTNNERLALINFMQPWQLPLPMIVGSIDIDDQKQLIWGYPGTTWRTTVTWAKRILTKWFIILESEGCL